MGWRSAAAVFLAVATSGTAAAWANTIDVRAEIEAVVYRSAATQAAYARTNDDHLRAEHERVETQIVQAKAGDVRSRRDTTALQASFDRDLAAKDQAYAQGVLELREAAMALGRTPDGAAALARFNTDDEAEALAAMDGQREARDKARGKPDPAASVAEARRIAALALDARQRGKLTTDQAIARFEALVGLGQARFGDWIALSGLYHDLGRETDARRAMGSAEKIASNDSEHANALIRLGHLLLDAGDLPGAGKVLGDGVPVFRRRFAAEPSDHCLSDLALALLLSGYERGLGRDAAGARAALEEGARLRRGLGAPPPENTTTRDAIAVALAVLGDTLAAAGDLDGARRADQESHAIFRNLLDANPGNKRWAIMSDATLGALADVLNAQRDFAGASKAYDELLANVRQRALENPGGMADQRALAVTLRDFAANAASEGDLPKARRAIEESLGIFTKLTAQATADVDTRAMADQAVVALGDILSRQGDIAGARKAYGKGLEVKRRRALAHPGDPLVQASLAAALRRTGYADAAQGDLTGGRQALVESLAIGRRLAANNAANGDLQDLIAFDTNALGEILTAQGDLPGAEVMFGQATTIYRRLAVAGDPAQTRLVEGLIKLAAVYQGRGDPISAQTSFGEAAVILGRLGPTAPSDPTIRALSATVTKFTVKGAPITWPLIQAQTEILFRQGALPADEIVWLRAVRLRAAHAGR